jgi:hypothetical protein
MQPSTSISSEFNLTEQARPSTQPLSEPVGELYFGGEMGNYPANDPKEIVISIADVT